MKKIIYPIVLLILIIYPSLTKAAYVAFSSQNNFEVSGDCSANIKIELIETAKQNRVAYSSGAACANGKFSFSDDLLKWNLPEGNYTLLVNGNKSGKTVSRKENMIDVQAEQPQIQIPAGEQTVQIPSSVAATTLPVDVPSNDILASKENVSVFSLNVDALKTMEADGALVIEKAVEFQAPAIFRAVTEFFDKVLFRNKVQFADEVIMNKDSGGYAIIKKGEDRVKISFEKEYSDMPIISATLSPQALKNSELQEAIAQYLLITNVKFIVTDVNTKGFEIRLDKKAELNFPFSWNVASVKDAQTF